MGERFLLFCCLLFVASAGDTLASRPDAGAAPVLREAGLMVMTAGSGGIRGLAAIKPAGSPAQFPEYDLNGNIVGLVDGSDGSASAVYEYGPFGELIRATGPMAGANPFRYSTKYRDDESGLSYYGYRYYSPSTGRWLSFDPAGEAGGLNLYGFVGNDSINKTDFLGLILGGLTGSVAGSWATGAEGLNLIKALRAARAVKTLEAAESAPTVSRIRNVAQQGYDYAVLNPRMQGLNRMQLGKDAEVQATRWLRRWAERNDVNLGPGGLQFQVRGANSVPDVVFDPARQIFDFKLTPRAVRPTQTGNFQTDFPGYNIEYIFGP
jgi:RHS repeat-associated protein